MPFNNGPHTCYAFSMSSAAEKRMTASEFLSWAETQARGRFELVSGEVIAMAPERADHARGKLAVCAALVKAIKVANIACEAFVDGLAVKVDESTVYEPDALVNCGPRIDGDAIIAPRPIIVAEVLSPSTERIDTHQKLIDYFTIASLHHYLVVDLRRRAVIHHSRADGSSIATRIVRDGEIELQPPGLALAVAELLDAG